MKKIIILFIFWIFICGQLFGTTYYVNKSGSNSNTCLQAQSSGTAKLTIRGTSSGISCLSAGDTLLIGDGTYAEAIAAYDIPSGSDDAHRTTIQAINAGQVIMTGANDVSDGLTIAARSYITIDGIVIDGHRAWLGHGTCSTDHTHYITFQNMKIIHVDQAGYSALNQSAWAARWSSGCPQHDHIVVKNTEIANVGDSTGHGIYPGGIKDSTFENNTIHDIVGHGFHLYNGSGVNNIDNNIIRNNYIYNTGSFCVGIYNGTNNQFYNNICNNVATAWASGSGAVRIKGTNSKIYSNTFYNIRSGNYVFEFQSGNSGTDIRNNILNTYTTGTFHLPDASTVYSNNLCAATGTGCSLSGNPLFVNPGSANFALSAGSPAINSGYPLGSPYNVDYAGITRANGTTTGSAYDVGALEYQSPPAPSTITVLTPNGGESVQTGATLSITWSSINVTGSVHIELTRNGSTYEDIIASTANDGAHDWTVTGASSTTCKIRISDVNTGAILDQSDANFTITGSVTGTITILSPITGQITLRGSDLVIRWSSTDVTGNVKIELSKNNGSTWTEIVASTAYNSPDIIHVDSGPSSSQAKIKITSLNDPSVTATSGAFRIGSTITLLVQ